MKAVVFSSLLSLALAGTVNIDIHRERSPTNRNRGNELIREIHAANGGDVVPEALANGFYAYLASLYVGSDRQFVNPAIDTGSSDLWLMEDSNPYCGRDFNCSGQTFDPSQSTTFRNTTKPWDIAYLDTTGAFGYLSQDTVEVDGKSVRSAYFGLAGVANSSEAVLGVGLTGNEATVRHFANGTQGGYTYPNLPISLKQQGYIDRIAYSLYLNGINATDGQILFGGVDRSKYENELGLVPLVNAYPPSFVRDVIEFTIMLDQVSVRTGNSSCPLDEMQVPMLLDSGTSYAIVPPAMLRSMGTAMGYVNNTEAGYFAGSCTQDFGFDSFELDFSGVKLQVPPATLLDKATDAQGNPINGPDGEQLCVLAVEASPYVENFILGDVFMRNFYIVYDLEGMQVALAQTKFNEEDESDVVPIVSTIPGATTAPGYSNTAFQTNIKTFDNYHQCFATAVSSTTSNSSQISSSAPTASSQSLNASSVVSTTASASSSSQAAATPSAPGSASSAGVSSAGVSSAAASSAAPASSAAKSSNAVEASKVVVVEATKYTTIPCSAPTTFSYNSQIYTVSEATTLTVEDCGCTETPVPVSTAPATKYTTIPCSAPTTVTYNSQVYTVTEATTLTVEDCGCTETPVAVTTVPASGPASGPATGPASGPATGPATAPTESTTPDSAASTKPAESGSPAASESASTSPAGASETTSPVAGNGPSTKPKSPSAASSPSPEASNSAAPSVAAASSAPSAPALANGATKVAVGALSALSALVLLI